MDPSGAVCAVYFPETKRTVAALFIGLVCAAIGYGAGCLQMMRYAKSNMQDTAVFKTLIWFLWICDTTHTGLISHALYFYFVLNFGNSCAILTPIWSLAAEACVSLGLEFAVRSVFIGRVWSLSKHNIILTVFLGLFNLGALGMGGYFSYIAFTAENFEVFAQPRIKWLVVSTLALHLFVDLNITLSLSILLRRSRTGFDIMDDVLRTLVGYVVHTGLSTMLVSALVLATFLVDMNSFIFIGVYFLLCKVFFNALLASLNARAAILASTVEAGYSMTVLSKRQGEESRKDYDTLHNVRTPSMRSIRDLLPRPSYNRSAPDLHVSGPGLTRQSSLMIDPYTAPPVRRPVRPRRPSQSSVSKSLRRTSTTGDEAVAVPPSPRRPVSILKSRPAEEGLIPELPHFTHRINLDGRDSALSSPSPMPLDSIFLQTPRHHLHNSSTSASSSQYSLATVMPETTPARESELAYHDEEYDPLPRNPSQRSTTPRQPSRYPTFIPF